MTDSHIHAEWAGEEGRKKAKLFNSRGRRIIERVVFGNYWTSFNKELITQISTGNEQILDLGAGSGNFSLPIARKLKDGMVTCLDSSIEMTDHLVAMAQKENLQNKIKIINGNAMQLELEDNSFDWAVCGNMMHELSDPLSSFKELRRVLKENGSVFIADFRNWHGYHGGDAHGPFAVKEFIKLFQDAGFQYINVSKKRHFVVGTAKK